MAARAETTVLLYGTASEEIGGHDPSAERTMQVGIAGWSFAHGFATLWASGNLQHRLGDDPTAAARRVAKVLFRSQ